MSSGHGLGIGLTGLLVGFLSGMFGKGGSAIATPILHIVGVSAIIAVASPLPATVPSTLVAAIPYGRAGFIDRRVVVWGAVFGVPATIVGALLTQWMAGNVLVLATDVVIVALAVRILITKSSAGAVNAPPAVPLWRLGAVVVTVGLISGLLANSGGFLLAPLFIVALGLSVRHAFGSSLVLSAVLALPGTVVHALLGHIDWTVTLIFAVAAVPLAAVGARVALKTKTVRLERMYAVLLIIVGAASLTQLLV